MFGYAWLSGKKITFRNPCNCQHSFCYKLTLGPHQVMWPLLEKVWGPLIYDISTQSGRFFFLPHVKSDVSNDVGLFLAFMGAVWESCRRVYQPAQICFLTQSSAFRPSGGNQERELHRLDRHRLILQLPTPIDVINLLQQLKQSGGKSTSSIQKQRRTASRTCESAAGILGEPMHNSFMLAL